MIRCHDRCAVVRHDLSVVHAETLKINLSHLSYDTWLILLVPSSTCSSLQKLYLIYTFTPLCFLLYINIIIWNNGTKRIEIGCNPCKHWVWADSTFVPEHVPLFHKNSRFPAIVGSKNFRNFQNHFEIFTEHQNRRFYRTFFMLLSCVIFTTYLMYMSNSYAIHIHTVVAPNACPRRFV